jgi:hypothetical protein
MPKAASFESFEKELNRLVSIFERGLAEFKSSGYMEAQLRDAFLNPLFRALGWDLENSAGLIQTKREVEVESRTEIDGQQKRADYLFRTDGHDRFICEAKKPAEELHSRFAFQAKRYAWNKGLPLAILSDFEEFKIYIVGGKPHQDEPLVGLWKSWHFRELPLIAPEIWNLLARDKIAAGSIEQLLESLPKTPVAKGKARQQWLIKPDRSRSLDADFLNFLDEARRDLASDLIRHNDRADLLEGSRLNEAVQHILDRILFLRICEARDIDTGTRLDSIVQTWRRNFDKEEGVRDHQKPLEFREEPPADHGYSGIRAPKGSLWRGIVRHFRALDRRPPSHVPFFNGNLFKPHFCEELIVGDDWLAGFVADLSDEESPYLFNYIPVEILGTIYERFLGKIVRPQGRGVTIEEKPEVRKAGGVYYTPRYIVEYIVAQTIEKLLHGVSLDATLKLHFLDPACGSGSFLLRVFESVCEHWQQWFMSKPGDRKKRWCWVDEKTGDVHLTMSLKRQILTSNVFGVDLDPGAVEVTQLSLYLKMLENENRNTLQRQRELLPDDDAPLLPPLENNIRCGNSLIASDFSMIPDDLVRVRAFDWNVGFKDIMKAGGFDAVVGNPPYIRIQGFPADQVSYFVKNYHSATGNHDIYINFVERGFGILRKTGFLGMILPNKFFRTDYGIGLRKLLSAQTAVYKVVDFGAEQVFEATTYTCLLFLCKQAQADFAFSSSKANALSLKRVSFERRPSASLNDDAWNFTGKHASQLGGKIRAAGVRLLDLPAEMSRGSSSGDDEVFMVDADLHGLERKVLRTPLFASDFGRYHFAPEAKWRIIFPYVGDGDNFRLLAASEFRQQFPRAFGHLQQHEGRLRERKQFKEWFGYSAPRNLELHDCAEIAVPLLANGGVFALIPQATRGTLCPMASGGFTITLGAKCAVKPEFVLGLLNSKLLFWYLRQISNVFRGGWITCTKQYFGELPIRSIDFSKPTDKARHDRLVGLVDKLLGLMPKLQLARGESEGQTLQNAVTAADQQIDALVYELYGLTEKEIQLVEGSK